MQHVVGELQLALFLQPEPFSAVLQFLFVFRLRGPQRCNLPLRLCQPRFYRGIDLGEARRELLVLLGP